MLAALYWVCSMTMHQMLVSQVPGTVCLNKHSMVCRRSFAAKASLLAIETALLTRRQQSADHKDMGVTVNTE